MLIGIVLAHEAGNCMLYLNIDVEVFFFFFLFFLVLYDDGCLITISLTTSVTNLMSCVLAKEITTDRGIFFIC